MIPANILEGAEKYVDIQLATMRKYGSCPRLSKTKRKAMVERIATIVLKAREAKDPVKP